MTREQARVGARVQAGPLDVVLPLVWPRAGSAWIDRAACLQHPDLAWTDDRHQVDGTDLARMAEVCAGCPVRSWCAAASSSATAGFWAGHHREPLHPSTSLASTPSSSTGAA